MRRQGIVQLPDDVVSRGYQKATYNPFEFEAIYHSPKHNFTGTEEQFVQAGFGYRYIDLGDFKRLVVG